MLSRSALLVALLSLFAATFTLRLFVVPSISMEPTVQAGDVILVDRLGALLRLPPSEESIIVFRPPLRGDRADYIKRVVARSGDRFSLLDGVLRRNDRIVTEPYIAEPAAYDLQLADYTLELNGAALDPERAMIPPRSQWAENDRVPNGYAVVLGDNRNYSDDSHLWGFLPLRGRLVGRAIAVIWPLGRIHSLL
ncbi:MAG TPA: signal peptidase I [Candidatus Dormibacteraeota bacterium]|nr:signal peptidase I [Candidatus Dormibacteraeota bacterium]